MYDIWLKGFLSFAFKTLLFIYSQSLLDKKSVNKLKPISGGKKALRVLFKSRVLLFFTAIWNSRNKSCINYKETLCYIVLSWRTRIS